MTLNPVVTDPILVRLAATRCVKFEIDDEGRQWIDRSVTEIDESSQLDSVIALFDRTVPPRVSVDISMLGWAEAGTTSSRFIRVTRQQVVFLKEVLAEYENSD
jgi:hypothetical protein